MRVTDLSGRRAKQFLGTLDSPMNIGRDFPGGRLRPILHLEQEAVNRMEMEFIVGRERFPLRRISEL